MRQQSYLVRKGARYHFRRRIGHPACARPISISLGTADPSKARCLARRLAVKWDELDMGMEILGGRRTLSLDEQEALFRRGLKEELARATVHITAPEGAERSSPVQHKVLAAAYRAIARISQLIDAAAAESSLSNLAVAISDPARIPVRFWEAVAQHIKRLRPRDENEGAGGRRSIEEFHLVVNRLVTELRASETSISYAACLERLGISSATKKSTRRRHVGERHKIAGTSECVGFNLTRAGGAAISLPPALTAEQAKTVLKTVLAELSRLLVAHAPAPDRRPQE